jgi:hypothetical protein
MEARQKRSARAWVARMVRRGALDRQPCRVCGASPAEAHHPDYSRPLTIVWLCAQHHRDEHRPVEPGQLVLWLGA